MDSTNYIEILNEIVVPFGQATFGNDYILHQDNSPIHTSEECARFIETEGIRWVNITSNRSGLFDGTK